MLFRIGLPLRWRIMAVSNDESAYDATTNVPMVAKSMILMVPMAVKILGDLYGLVR